jgi:hypothetical protein
VPKAQFFKIYMKKCPIFELKAGPTRDFFFAWAKSGYGWPKRFYCAKTSTFKRFALEKIEL